MIDSEENCKFDLGVKRVKEYWPLWLQYVLLSLPFSDKSHLCVISASAMFKKISSKVRDYYSKLQYNELLVRPIPNISLH